jgi:hypothetical protein
MNLFRKAEPAGTKDLEAIARIKEWTRELLGLEEGAAVMVSELTCTEPGCPPLETVIAVFRLGGGSDKRKLHRAIHEVTRGELAAAWSSSPHQD